MLKPSDPIDASGTGDERPIGELVHQLVEDGKSYAHAELGLARTIAAEKGKALALPAALFGAAFVLVLAGACALAVSVVLALDDFVGPLLAGVIALLLFAAVAGGLAWVAIGKIRSGL